MNPFWAINTIPNMHLQIPYGQRIVSYKLGDVSGDGFPDLIYLTANNLPDNTAFLRNITLFIKYGRTNHIEKFNLPENAGYNPTIWLGDVTGDGIDDILIIIDSGGSGAIIFAYIYSMQYGRMKKIFDSIQFNEEHPYQVIYANNYQANLFSENPKNKFIISLQSKDKEYLNEIYQPDGTLKQPIEGWVDPISGLYPIDLARNGKFQLLGMQLIAGRYHADSLGFVENLLFWDGKSFKIDRQTVAIFPAVE